jgi:caffeoyl-CoA O-methyltransferase
MEDYLNSLLLEMEKTRETYWNISREVGEFLSKFIRDNNYKTVLEIGTSTGYSGIWLAKGLCETAGRLYTIESHKKERYQIAQENFKNPA